MKTLIQNLFIALGLLALPTLVQAQFSFTTNNGAITITGYNTAAGLNAVIPAATNGYPVTSIGDDAFYFSSLTSVTIPNSVTSIGDFAFDDCSSLTNLTVIAGNPDYSSISGVLFNQNQTMLIQFPAGLGGSYTISNSVTSIGGGAFAYTSLTSVTIPNSVTSIGDQAFYDCIRLTSVTIPNSVTSIGADEFEDCTSLTSVTIGNSVTSIGIYAFAVCTSLTSVTIPNSVASIGNGAFDDCTSLTSVTIGNSVTNIGFFAFYTCTRLTNVTFLGNAPVLRDATEFTDDGIATKVVYYYAGTSGWGSTYGGLPTVMLNAPSPSPISGIGVQNNGFFGFTFTGTNTQVIVVDASTNLANPNWQPLQTNTLTGTTFNFTDSQWTKFPRRFYRIGFLP